MQLCALGPQTYCAKSTPAAAASLSAVKNRLVVRAAVRGYKKEDIEVSVSDSLLTIKGGASKEEKEEKGSDCRSIAIS